MQPDTYYVGIDPGKTGAWAVLDEKLGIKDLAMNDDLYYFAEVLQELSSSGATVFACVEKAHAMPQQGSVSTFSFGEQFGLVQGILIASNISYELVSSNRWQKTVLDFLPAKGAKADNEGVKDAVKRRAANRKSLKDATVAYCIRRWSETIEVFKKKKNQGASDALCLALYCAKRI